MAQIKVLIGIVAALLTISLVQGYILSPNKCSETIKPMPGFSVAMFADSKIWYDYAQLSSTAGEYSRKCGTDQDIYINETSWKHVYTKLDKFTDKYTESKTILMADGIGLLKDLSNSAADGSFNYNGYMILDSDYVTYSIFYGCRWNGSVSTVDAWISTSERFPNQATVQKAVQVLLSNKISIDNMDITHQLNCERNM